MPDRSFVQAVATLIELARGDKAYQIIRSNLIWMRCAHGWPYAVLELRIAENGMLRQIYRPRSKEGTKAPSLYTLQHHELVQYPTPIFAEASVRGEIISALADLLGPVQSEYANFGAVSLDDLIVTSSTGGA